LPLVKRLPKRRPLYPRKHSKSTGKESPSHCSAAKTRANDETGSQLKRAAGIEIAAGTARHTVIYAVTSSSLWLLILGPHPHYLRKQKMNYVFSTRIDQPIDDAIETLKAALMKQHLGIISDVNVANIIKNKLDMDMPPYRLLGACNPKMAKTMLDDLPEVGVLLPCTIVAREVDGATVIDFMDPVGVLGIANNDVVNRVAQEADEKLKAVIADLEQH
jgi:uncharacterized protein (DUF302 family)